MKAITEERLRRFRETCDPRDRYALDTLIKECQELDTLTVTKLRPMSDIPIGEIVLMKIKLMDSFYATVISEDDYLDGCEGWLPMPTYKPEKK